MIFRHTNDQVCAEGVCITKRLEVIFVKLCRAGFKVFAMLSPSFNSVTVLGNTNSGKYFVPQSVHCFFFGKIRENFLCP